MIGDVTNHLWQSTLFVLAAIVVTSALRKNGAHIRHAIWVIASVKFLVPFAWLMALGALLPAWTPPPAPSAGVPLDYSGVVERIAEPFSSGLFVSAARAAAEAPPPIDWTMAFAVVWAMGFAAVVGMRLRSWRRVRAAARASVPMPLASACPVRSTPGLLEPGVVGLWRPVLLVPAGIESRLTPAQLSAVLEHEFAHVRRRDNLTAAVHMAVEAVFWFHPLVWWVGARMVEERERACDEHVLRVCGEPQMYAESILNVCKLYVESPLACVSGVTGADLKRRITTIVGNHVGLELTMVRRAGLGIAAALALGAPLLAGAITAPPKASPASAVAMTARQATKFEVVSIKPCDTSTPAPRPPAPAGGRSGGSPWSALTSPGYVYWHCATLAQLIPQAYASSDQPLQNVVAQPKAEDNFQPQHVKGGPPWVRSDKFTIEAKAALDVTGPALDGRASRALTTLTPAMSQALRVLLEDRFQLKVRRATEQRDVYALTLATGGLNKAKVTSPVPGDCVTVEAYFASPAASAPLEERMKNAGTLRLCGRASNYIFSSFTFSQLAVYLQNGGLLGDVVVNQTGLEAPFNFEMVMPPRSEGAVDERVARALEPLGLKLERVKAPAESLVVESVQRLRPNRPADR